MPNVTVRANAQTAPIDRRLFLASGAAAAVFGALHAAASPLEGLMEAHRSAWRAFDDICAIEGDLLHFDPKWPAVNAEWKRLEEIEAQALEALCAFRPTTVREIHLRGDYLADFLIGAQLNEDQLEALLESFRSPDARPGVAFRRDV